MTNEKEIASILHHKYEWVVTLNHITMLHDNYRLSNEAYNEVKRAILDRLEMYDISIKSLKENYSLEIKDFVEKNIETCPECDFDLALGSGVCTNPHCDTNK